MLLNVATHATLCQQNCTHTCSYIPMPFSTFDMLQHTPSTHLQVAQAEVKAQLQLTAHSRVRGSQEGLLHNGHHRCSRLGQLCSGILLLVALGLAVGSLRSLFVCQLLVQQQGPQHQRRGEEVLATQPRQGRHPVKVGVVRGRRKLSMRIMHAVVVHATHSARCRLSRLLASVFALHWSTEGMCQWLQLAGGHQPNKQIGRVLTHLRSWILRSGRAYETT